MPEVFIKKSPRYNDTVPVKHLYDPSSEEIIVHHHRGVTGRISENLAAYMPSLVALSLHDKVGERAETLSQVVTDVLPPFSDFATNTADIYIELQLMWNRQREAACDALRARLQASVEEIFVLNDWKLPYIDYQIRLVHGSGVATQPNGSWSVWSSTMPTH